MLAAAGSVPPETRDLIKRVIGALVRAATVGKVAGAASRAAGAAEHFFEAASQAASELSQQMPGPAGPRDPPRRRMPPHPAATRPGAPSCTTRPSPSTRRPSSASSAWRNSIAKTDGAAGNRVY